MSVYVDGSVHSLGRMVMCHMLADTTAELLSMVRLIEVNAKWIQKHGTAYEHFDICKSKRELALQNGAIEVSSREMAKITMTRRLAIREHTAEMRRQYDQKQEGK